MFKQMPTFDVLIKYMVKENIIHLKVQIFIFFLLSFLSFLSLIKNVFLIFLFPYTYKYYSKGFKVLLIYIYIYIVHAIN